MHKLATWAGQFLVAACVRSTEARRRVFTEISNILNDFVDSSNGFRPPGNDIQAFIDLLNDVLAARSPTGAYISAEASATFIDVGLVRPLTRTLQALDLDHVDSPKAVMGLIKALEVVTKEHVHSADSNTGKGENSTKPPDHNQPGRVDDSADVSQSMGTSSQPSHDVTAADHVESFNTTQTYGGSEAFEHNEAAVQDVEAVSQESSGSGATLGESLRSLDVEIVSADGHDDGGERQGSADRMPLGDMQATRTRRTNVSFGNSTPLSGRDASLHSATEVSENPSQEADQVGPGEKQRINADADSGSIDPAFLDALPDELRAEVLSAQQGQVAQPSNTEQKKLETYGNLKNSFDCYGKYSHGNTEIEKKEHESDPEINSYKAMQTIQSNHVLQFQLQEVQQLGLEYLNLSYNYLDSQFLTLEKTERSMILENVSDLRNIMNQGMSSGGPNMDDKGNIQIPPFGSIMVSSSLDDQEENDSASQPPVLSQTSRVDVLALDVSAGELKWRIGDCHPGVLALFHVILMVHAFMLLELMG
ncbi:hypothetical protein PVL29_027279 [Vitis rotundifolia]|uniref:Uncharacterized protein n=1 Tax=Vitis rotundifolia TaxID=103349 RepID=A0AA39D595_VITRO|nr:hypothetical protein PVL29_027279 [Vitis rotundifolia]